MSKAPNCPTDAGDQRQDAKRGDETTIGQPEHQQEPHNSGNRGVFVLDRQLKFLRGGFAPDISGSRWAHQSTGAS